MGDAPHSDPRVDLALARSYIRDTRDTPFTAGFTAALLWLWFAWLTQQWGVLVWAVLVHGMQIHMHRHLHAVDPEAIAAGDASAWRRRLEWRMLFPGLVWAMGPWLLLPPPQGDLTQLLVMYFCFGGFASVVISLLTQWWLAALCFGVPVMLSLALRLAVSPLGSIGWIMSALVLWQLLTTLYYARKQNRLIVSALETNLENARLAEALRAQLDRVAELAAQRARVFAAANHDLRQPLHALAIFVDTLHPGEPPRPASIGYMRDSVDALRISIDALLDIAQMDRGAEQPAMNALPLAPMFAALRGRFESAAVAKDLHLRIRPTPAAVWADERLLARLLGNLVDNAIKYTARGTVLVAARPARTEDGEPAWRIEVRDSGQGVAPAHAARVFEEFFQVDNPGRNRARGLGLGLALVASMARALGSAIRLRSRLGEGSTFSLVLRQAPPPPEPEAAQAGAWPGRQALPALRVLVLDDEAPVRDAMQTLLGGWGHVVATAASPGEALQQEGVFDLLVCDLRLAHGLSGLTAANTLLGIGKVRRVIVLTGETGHEDCRQVEAAGHALLYKPASAERLQAMMSDVMAGPAPASIAASSR